MALKRNMILVQHGVEPKCALIIKLKRHDMAHRPQGHGSRCLGRDQLLKSCAMS